MMTSPPSLRNRNGSSREALHLQPKSSIIDHPSKNHLYLVNHMLGQSSLPSPENWKYWNWWRKLAKMISGKQTKRILTRVQDGGEANVRQHRLQTKKSSSFLWRWRFLICQLVDWADAFLTLDLHLCVWLRYIAQCPLSCYHNLGWTSLDMSCTISYLDYPEVWTLDSISFLDAANRAELKPFGPLSSLKQ